MNSEVLAKEDSTGEVQMHAKNAKEEHVFLAYHEMNMTQCIRNAPSLDAGLSLMLGYVNNIKSSMTDHYSRIIEAQSDLNQVLNVELDSLKQNALINNLKEMILSKGLVKKSLKVKKLSELAKTPQFATAGAACFDLSCTEGGFVHAGESAIFSTGLSFEVPEGYVMLIYSRSGHGFKNSVRLSNCVGVIDSDYRGEVKVKLSNDGRVGFTVNNGDRIAQAMLQKVEDIEIELTDSLSETERGTAGFGSTGVN